MLKTVLITGSSKGLGKETAILFAKKKYNVILNYNQSKKAAVALKNEIETDYNVKCLCIKCDVSIEEEVKNMYNEVLKEFKNIDCIVNNAAVCKNNFIENKTSEEFLNVVSTNLLGPFLVTKYFGKIINKNGSIINVSSNNGLDMTSPLSMDYDASKAGLINMTKNMAKYYMPYIRVNAVAPGYIDTDMDDEKNIDNVLLQRVGKKSEIANVIYFLASEESSYINGEVIRVDGGIM